MQLKIELQKHGSDVNGPIRTCAAQHGHCHSLEMWCIKSGVKDTESQRKDAKPGVMYYLFIYCFIFNKPTLTVAAQMQPQKTADLSVLKIKHRLCKEPTNNTCAERKMRKRLGTKILEKKKWNWTGMFLCVCVCSEWSGVCMCCFWAGATGWGISGGCRREDVKLWHPAHYRAAVQSAQQAAGSCLTPTPETWQERLFMMLSCHCLHFAFV